MLFLRKCKTPGHFDICNDRGCVVEKGQTELEVRRYLRDLAVAKAKVAANMLLQDAMPCLRP